MTERVAVIGRGTAGCLTAAWWAYRGHNIDWYYSSGIPPTPVGEGTTPNFIRFLADALLMGNREIHKFQGTAKLGVNYRNWGNNKPDWVHYFGGAEYGIHFNASKFQERIFEIAENTENINTIDAVVNPQELEGYKAVLSCTGKLLDENVGYTPRKYIPVNAVHVTQCYRDKCIESSFTDTIARKWGWVFIVPLQNRASVGYLYNKDITSLDAVKEDVQNVFDEYRLNPSDTTNSFTFGNYSKDALIEGNVYYNGNSAFFLEPMEATTIDCSLRLAESYYNAINGGTNSNTISGSFKGLLDEIELFIMLRYAAGSNFKTEFWDFAQDSARRCIEQSVASLGLKDVLYNGLHANSPQRNISRPIYLANHSVSASIEGLGVEKLIQSYVG